METKEVHISTLQRGDLILHAGEVKTLTNSNLKRDAFMGASIYGDSYNAGHKPVTLITNLNK